MEFIDVDKISSLPKLNDEKRYFDTIGGEKNFRCFIVQKDLPRNVFLFQAEDKGILDKCLKPIFNHDGITVRQDSSYPLPGFYIVAPDKHFTSFDEVDVITYQRMMFIIYQIRKIMRAKLKINYLYLLYEEKSNISCNVHYWLLPITDVSVIPRLYKLDIKKYLESFCVKKNYEEIIEYNEIMIDSIRSEKLYERDSELKEMLKKIFI